MGACFSDNKRRSLEQTTNKVEIKTAKNKNDLQIATNGSNYLNPSARESKKNKDIVPQSQNGNKKVNTNSLINSSPVKDLKQKNNNNISKSNTKISEIPPFYFSCPGCKKYIPWIKRVSFQKEEKEYYVEYKCYCTKNEFQTAKFSALIENKKPSINCNMHPQNELSLYCKTCRSIICQKCKEERHSSHNVQDSSFLINAMENKNKFDFKLQEDLIRQKEENFKKEFNEKKEKFSNEMDNFIEELKNYKKDNITQMDQFYNNQKGVFDATQNLYNIYNKDKSGINPVYLHLIKKLQLNDNINNIETNISDQIKYFHFQSDKIIMSYNINFKHIDNKTNYKCFQTLKAPTKNVSSLVKLSNGCLASGSFDTMIIIWDLNTYKAKSSLQEEGSVLCLLEFEPEFILSGTSENNIHLWNLNTEQIDAAFKDHSKCVNALTKVNSNTFASCSNDTTIKIWDYNERKLISTLNGHDKSVLALITLKDGHLCSGGEDNTIRIWDWENSKEINAFSGHSNGVQCLCQLSNGNIISGSDDCTIMIWDINGKCLTTINEHKMAVRALCPLKYNWFISGSFDNDIKIWNSDFQCKQTLTSHQFNVVAITLIDDNNFVSCSNDETIKLWK